MENNFNPGFDREKLAFLELANRGGGLDPINYIYAKDISCDTILSPSITGGTAEFYTIYSSGINSNTITNNADIITNRLKWSNPGNDYCVGFIAGNLTQNTIWTLPLQDGTNGQALATNGNGILSFIDVAGQAAPSDATYILQIPNEKLPNAQALNELENGLMKNNEGVIQIAIPGQDYLTPSLPSGQLFIGNSSNLAMPEQTITIDNLPSLGVASISVPNPLDPTTPITISGGKIWHGTDANRPEESTALLVVEGDIALINFRFFSANFILGKGNAVLQTLMPGSQFLSNLTPSSWLQTSQTGNGAIVAATIPQNELLMGGLNNIPETRPTIALQNLPGLTNGSIWQGDATDRPVEIQLNFAPSDATYIIKTPNAALTEAQVISELGIGMAKIVAGGAFAIAIPDEDYATVATLQELADQAAASAEEATVAATEATAAAGEATGAAVEATAAAAEASLSATGAGVSALAAAASALAAGGSASSASSSASDASDSADNASSSATEAQNYLNTLLSTGLNALPCTGDVSFQGFKLINLGTPIVATDGATKGYVDTAIGNVPLASLTLQGDVIGSGPLNVPVITTLTKTLNEITNAGNINIANFLLNNVLDPLNPQDGATKNYVDSAISSSSSLVSLSGAISGSGQTGTVVNTILSSLIGLTTNQVFNFTGSSASFNYDLTIPNSANQTLKLRLNREILNGAGYEFQFYAPISGVDTFTFGYNSGVVGSPLETIYSIANNAPVINYTHSLNVNDAGTYKPYSGSYGYLNSSGSTGQASGQNSYSINCTNRVKASEFNAVSSKKIKTILGRGEEIEHTAIELFKKIPLFKYKYKDTIKEGDADHYGVIAEELAEVIPAFVNMQDEGWIPNIYKNCIAEKGLDNSYKLYFDEKLENIEGSRLKLIFRDKEGEKNVEVMITEITVDSLSVICCEKLPRDIFIYGTYSTCPTVSKQKVFELALVVLQNIIKRVETFENRLRRA